MRARCARPGLQLDSSRLLEHSPDTLLFLLRHAHARSAPTHTPAALWAHRAAPRRACAGASAASQRRYSRVSCDTSAVSGSAPVARRTAVLLPLLAAPLLAAAAAPAPAHAKGAPSGFNPVKDTQKGYAFFYPVGWQVCSLSPVALEHWPLLQRHVRF
jgi:hypothetical protein